MIPINSCRACVWFVTNKRCLAFPDGIPDPIWMGENDHKKPYKGDHGIQYDPVDDTTPDNKK